MKSIIIATIFVAACSSVIADDPKWSDFRGSFLIGKEESFAQFPRSIRVEQFSAENWTAVSSTQNDCTNGGLFNGIQYVKNGNDYSVALLYDVNGVIAGIQMLIPHTVIDPENRVNYGNVPMYNNATYGGEQYFVLTMYLVEPSTICQTGRTDETLASEGTGTGMWIQNGPTPSQTLQLPATRPEGDEARSSGWTQNHCFPAMGYHNFYQADQYIATNCTEMKPIFGLYNKDLELHGFGFITPGTIINPRFEQPPASAIKMILGKMDGDEVPQCVLDIQASKGVTSLHVYMIPRPWFITCDLKRAAGEYITSAVNWLRNLG